MKKQYQTKRIELGGCRSPHGIKGGFSCFLYNTQESTLHNGSKIFVLPEDKSSSIPPDGQEMKINTISIGGKEHKAIVYLAGVSGRTQVEEMIPFIIQVERDSLPLVGPDQEFYVVDLMGHKVSTVESGIVGEISDYYLLENDSVVFTIKTTAGEQFDLPFTNHFFPHINLEKGEVEIVMPEVIED
ncbi:MAG: 16S rRNA processing protein RimM, partial [Bdellovibrionales bacterium]|nr:16S rRNA processing protein RimM [Bdellovibrionales bacterium]